MAEVTSLRSYLHILSGHGMLGGYNPYLDDEQYEHAKGLLSNDIYSMDVYYRGQPAKYPTIISGLPRSAGYEVNENAMYEETLRTKSADFSSFHTPLACLSKMQHYGMPTRLIDFTVNPLIALFFAVQYTADGEDAIVYVYSVCGVEHTEDTVQILSLLPTLRSKSVAELRQQALEMLEIDKTEDEIREIACSNVFVKYTDTLEESNPRLHNQCGTFAICGNVVEDGELTDKVCALHVDAALTVKIPQEFKSEIYHDLDLYFGINDNFIYPELTAWSDYIRRKYADTNFDPHTSYTVIDKSDVSLPEIQRLEIKLVLNRSLTIDQIKACVREAVKAEAAAYPVVWVSVATDGDNYASANWIVQAQWIAPNTSLLYSRFPAGQIDSNRFSWEYAAAPTEQEQYQAENQITEQECFLIHHYVYRALYPHYQSIEYGYEILDYEVFCSEVEKRAHFIRGFCTKLSAFSRPKNRDLDRYILHYIDFSVALCDITYWIKLRETDENWLDYRITRCFSTIRNALTGIDRDKQKWMETLELSNNDMTEEAFAAITKAKMKFQQTLPLASDPLPVAFQLAFAWNNGDLVISGVTNLYDKAKLMLSLDLRYGKSLAQETAVVKNGKFESIINAAVLKHNHYRAAITLSFPRNQSIEFLDKAGQEYEKLGGEYIDHQGINSTMRYVTDFSIDGRKITLESAGAPPIIS